MTTQVLPIEAGADDDDVVVTAGTPVLICLMGADGVIPEGARVDIVMQGSDGEFYKLGDLRSDIQSRSVVLYAPGTYTIERQADSAAVGVFSA